MNLKTAAEIATIAGVLFTGYRYLVFQGPPEPYPPIWPPDPPSSNKPSIEIEPSLEAVPANKSKSIPKRTRDPSDLLGDTKRSCFEEHDDIACHSLCKEGDMKACSLRDILS